MSNYIKLLRIILVTCIFLAVASVETIFAADENFVNSTLRVSPILLRIQLEPGTKRLYPITIENLSNAPMPIHANVEGFDPSDEQSGFTPNPPSEASPLSKWISIEEPDTIIPARDSHEFFIKITIPGTVPLGGYYAIIYFTPLYPNGTIGSKIGVVTLANIGVQDSLTNKASISSFQFEKLIYEHGPITSTLRITNDALHYFSTKPTLTIAPYWGNPDTVELDEKTILPGKSRLWKTVFTVQNSKWGIYKASIHAKLENGDTISKTIPLIMLPYTVMFVSIFMLFVLIWFFTKRKNISRAIQALTAKETDTSTQQIQPPPLHKTMASVGVQESYDTVSVDDPSRMSPTIILQTLKDNGGSVSKTASILGIHRSTIHRWIQREQQLHISGIGTLKRKSTRPIRMRTTTVPPSQIRHILMLHTKKHMTAKQIKVSMNITVSDRTILRIIKKHISAIE